ncbi:hypothetical protein ETD86_44850 [Nonomuraea turkmeniaca]|uniref:Uncharacterized protein n=1 Tax=Nonomuraea turkmeniaca TaxID=103838 RepID=A0A5S4EZU1_9ACTN|nr:hypothetical protein [Nonomuraea turkmeniaca]TMR09150.1 hypothetical protein ETD86_44850 [Nonomuraea turkmeniaca]
MTEGVIPSISKLLAATGQFRHHGQKRFDDTMFFEYEAKRDGLDSLNGRAAVRAMNRRIVPRSGQPAASTA